MTLSAMGCSCGSSMWGGMGDWVFEADLGGPEPKNNMRETVAS